MSTYHCKHCGRAIFRSQDLLETVNLWDLGDYQAECHVIRSAIDIESLQRYDVSLHEGWYCCRFIMMRMLVDKFGTGEQLLVYKDSVTEVEDGCAAPAPSKGHGAIRLTLRDHDLMLNEKGTAPRLKVVRFGAIWCPPCRLMDSIVAQIRADALLPEVDFFEVDIDEQPELAGRFRNQSIPFTVFYDDGERLDVKLDGHPAIDGGIVGGLQKAELVALCHQLLSDRRQPARR